MMRRSWSPELVDVTSPYFQLLRRSHSEYALNARGILRPKVQGWVEMWLSWWRVHLARTKSWLHPKCSTGQVWRLTPRITALRGGGRKLKIILSYIGSSRPACKPPPPPHEAGTVPQFGKVFAALAEDLSLSCSTHIKKRVQG